MRFPKLIGAAIGLFLAITLTAPSALRAQDVSKEAEQAFEDANQLMEAKRFKDALARYQQVLAVAPEDELVLYNAGLAAYLDGQFGLAAEYWQQVKRLTPEDWQVSAKLIQAYQALGDMGRRDAERAELFGLRKAGTIPELAEKDSYCREQFQFEERRLMVFEHFELVGERALRYVFIILTEDGKDEDFQISLGSYETTNEISRRLGRLKEGERLFHLDGYFEWGHATYGFYNPEPSYDQVREQVVGILQDKIRPVSSTTVPKKK